MRKVLCSMMLVLAVGMTAIPVKAKSLVKFGVKGGFELTEINFNGDDLKESNRLGFYVGPVVQFELPITGLTIDASVLYSQRSLKVEDESLKQKSLLVPANARMGIGLGEVLGIFISAGPQISFNIGDDVFHWQDEDKTNNQFNLQNTMLSFNFGLGFTLFQRIEAGVYYNVPTGKTGDFTWDKLGSELEGITWNRAKSKTNAWHIGVSFYF